LPLGGFALRDVAADGLKLYRFPPVANKAAVHFDHDGGARLGPETYLVRAGALAGHLMDLHLFDGRE